MVKIDPYWLMSLTEDNYFKEIDSMVSDKAEIPCQDGNVVISKEMLQWSFPYLIFAQTYNTPITVKHFTPDGTVPTESVHKDMLQYATHHTHDYLKGGVGYPVISRLGVDVTRMQTNTSINYLQSLTISLDAEDYAELIYSPTLTEIRDELTKTVENASTHFEKGQAFVKAYAKTHDYIDNEGVSKHPDNGLVHLCVSKTIKKVQVNQGLVGVGYSSDVDSTFMSKPILNSYATGLNSVYEFIMNARSGAKALMYSHEPMKETEYLHRLVQMISACFNKVYVGDCGSKSTYPVRVTKARSKNMIGKYFIDPVAGLTELTHANVGQYIDKTINVRHVAGCRVPDTSGVCSVCGGAVTNSLGENAKVGWAMTTRNFSSTSQAVLSVKHSDLTLVGLATPINPALNAHVKSTEDGGGITFGKNRDYTIGIHVPNELKGRELYGAKLHELFHVERDKLADISPWEYSGFYNAEISRQDGSIEPVNVPLLDKREEVCLSIEVLHYLYSNPERIQLNTVSHQRKQYDIDLSEFPDGLPVFTTRFAHADTLKMFEVVNSFVRSGESKQKGEAPPAGRVLKSFHTFGDASLYMYDLLVEKMGINLSVIELSLYPFTVTSPADGDYTPVRNTNSCQFESITTLFNRRSLSAKLGSEQIDKVLCTPAFSAQKRRVASEYDTLFI